MTGSETSTAQKQNTRIYDVKKSGNIKIKGQNHTNLVRCERTYMLQICCSKTLNQAPRFNFWNAMEAHSPRKPKCLSQKVYYASWKFTFSHLW